MNQTEFQNTYCEKLNKQQKGAVYSVTGNTLLLAVPGSGKTTVLVNRLGYMVYCAGIKPENILTMTYTTAAAGEMQSRFETLFGTEYSGRLTFCTINSLCNKIINYTGFVSGKSPFSLISERNAQALIREIYQNINHEYATENVIKDIKSNITYIKNMNFSDTELKNEKFSTDHMLEIYDQYNKLLRSRKLMDFDDQLIYAYNLLTAFPDILLHFKNRFQYICVDEAQDTSKLQHEIIHLLAGKNGNLFMVGDEDQSIYGFRGAYPAALLNFSKEYLNAKVLSMEENYRSVEPIVKIANQFIAENTMRYKKNIIPTQGQGKNVQVIPVLGREEQYEYLLKHMDQIDPDTAVLFRNNESALPLIDLMERNNIPYNYVQKEISFFTHRVILDLNEIIQFADQPFNTDIFMDIYYKVGLHLNKEMAQFACRECDKTGKPILDILLGEDEVPSYVKENIQTLQDVLTHILERKPYGVLGEIWNVLEYGSYVSQRNMDAGKYQILRILSKQENTVSALLTRLDQLKQIIETHNNDVPGALTVSTIHSSKGLEYNCVYLIDVIDGILPLEPECDIENLEQHEEDRRVCYVGMTRAKKELSLFKCKGCKSQYIDEIEHFIAGKPLKKNLPVRGVTDSKLLAEKKPEPQKVSAVAGLSIVHKTMGPGVIQTVNGDLVTIWMRDLGKIKTFSWHKVLEEHLLVL